jgi:hypothetical protein
VVKRASVRAADVHRAPTDRLKTFEDLDSGSVIAVGRRWKKKKKISHLTGDGALI